jgi:hypothetical protein
MKVIFEDNDICWGEKRRYFRRKHVMAYNDIKSIMPLYDIRD